jgi:Nif-specific regulatory protein
MPPLDKLHELSLLLDISGILDRSPDLRDVMQPVLAALSEHLSMERATITLIDRETGDIVIEEAHGLTPDQLRRGRYRFGEGVIGTVVRTGAPIAIGRISDEPQFLDRTGARQGLRKEDLSFLCVPVIMENQVIGTLSADRLHDDSFPLEDALRVMAVIASMISRALRLRQSLQHENRRLLDENTRLKNELTGRFRPEHIIGNSR